jgi:anthranilate/para-aminobenzoate synthase component I
MPMDDHRLSLNDLCSHAYRVAADSAEIDISRSAGRGNYVLMLPRQKKAWAGFGMQQCIRYQHNRFIIEDDAGNVTEVASDDPLDSLAQVLYSKANYFFMISLDLHRPEAVSKLPTMIWVQAKHELLIDASQHDPYSSANGSADSKEWAKKLNQQVHAGSIQPLAISGHAQSSDWETEQDDVFVKRLGAAVEALQEIDGKVIVTRRYAASMADGLDPFRLYEIYNHLEPCCAASHFFQLDDNIYSLGCTPENIFSLQQRILDFDVVASTRGISSDPVKDARWEQELKSDSKELKEHMMALGRYQKRLGQLCKDNSVVMDHHLEVRQFRHVRHLYSHLYGELLDSINFFDLLKGSSPALCTYPQELIPVADDGVTPTRFYGGVVGRTASGFSEADVFLNLRSFFISDDEIRTMGGVGVVRESTPEQELVEVKNKLRCVMEAEALWKSEADE